MDKSIFVLLLILLVFSFVQCNTQETTEPDNNSFTVSGKVVYNGVPLEDVIVTIDDKLNLQSLTNSEGFFEIKNVTMGEHSFKAQKSFETGGFTEINYDIYVDDDINLDYLELPRAISLNAPSDITPNSMKITWARTEALDFREYKLFRHNTSGLDETTGLLIHVSTSFGDTSFVDKNLSPNTEYFYRVYVMNNMGRLGGSNIVSGITQQPNFIWNGDFELDEPLIKWWDNTIEGTVEYTDSLSVNGNRSLYMESDSVYTAGMWVTIADIGKSFTKVELPLELGRAYKLSGWIKTGGDIGPAPLSWPNNGATIRVYLGNNLSFSLNSIDSTWKYVEKVFITPENYSAGWIVLASTFQYTWFDDLKLETYD